MSSLLTKPEEMSEEECGADIYLRLINGSCNTFTFFLKTTNLYKIQPVKRTHSPIYFNVLCKHFSVILTYISFNCNQSPTVCMILLKASESF